MCKFTNRLFVTTFLLLVSVRCITNAAPMISPESRGSIENYEDLNSSFDNKFDLQSIMKLLEPYNDHDIHYDQRQTGKANFLTRMDGFLFILPTDTLPDMPDIPDPSHLELLEEFLSSQEREQSATEKENNMERAVMLANPPTAEPNEEQNLEKNVHVRQLEAAEQSQRKRKSSILSVVKFLKTLLKV